MCLPAFAAPKDDGSGPRAALLLYDKLVGPNEADKAMGLYHATATRERALAAALANCDGALANLHKKALDKWGAAAADRLVQALDGTTVDQINAAKIDVAGDTAVIRIDGSNNPTTMVRVNGEWKISVKSIARQVSTNLKNVRKSLAKTAAAANDVATKIEGGQLATADAAERVLKKAYAEAFRGAE
jgi:hypothetical protein